MELQGFQLFLLRLVFVRNMSLMLFRQCGHFKQGLRRDGLMGILLLNDNVSGRERLSHASYDDRRFSDGADTSMIPGLARFLDWYFVPLDLNLLRLHKPFGVWFLLYLVCLLNAAQGQEGRLSYRLLHGVLKVCLYL